MARASAKTVAVAHETSELDNFTPWNKLSPWYRNYRTQQAIDEARKTCHCVFQPQETNPRALCEACSEVEDILATRYAKGLK